MDIVEIARKAGMQILLDARIGRETYHSVCGSLQSLQHFADAVCAAAAAGTPVHEDNDGRREAGVAPVTLEGEIDGQIIAI
ncbi:hypothetical protein B0G76_8640 [Paraburkholderia sp. BL23I1N1]|uniref:hypothetical protein n=1 Tax=Paraburkholderia sp. BL23I1N1 TaxID=1938802 RepID=UPI000E732DFA|nr:hypothetical protein [Paraburkholderia sp. BL23I1N1]RKE23940.1 hypothetical protein B0G76_8640 [Paraburkholderia sp. BL23I1N1]